MAKLGQLLISRGWINLAQLTRALKTQSVVGGRLGTCLLEMDILTEEQLAKGLSEQLGLPGATIEQLRAVPEEVRGVLPAKVARRCHAVPFQLIGNRLDVAMLDPRNLTGHDEVAFASGRRVRVHVAPELRIFEALERYYNEECPSRFTLLLDRLNRARYLWKEEEKEREPEMRPEPEPIPNRRRSALGLDRFPDLPLAGTERGHSPLLDLPVSPAKPATGSVPIQRVTPDSLRVTQMTPLARPATPGGPLSRLRSPEPAPGAPISKPAAPAPPAALNRPSPPSGPSEPRETIVPPPPPRPPVAKVIPLTDEERADLAVEALPEPPPAPAPIPVATSIPVASVPAAPIPLIAPTTLDELSRALEATTNRDDLAELVLSFLVRRFDRAALFSIARGQVAAWLAMGKDVDPQAFGKYRVGLDQPSVFLNLDRGNSLYLGPLPPMPAHRDLAKTWGGALPQRACMLPIRLGTRLIAVLYADGNDASWTGFGIDVLNRLRVEFAAALERCIRERRGKSA